jgi:hypothetical protein
MRSTPLRSGLLGSVIVLFWATADAQPVATSLAELEGLANAESKVTMTDTTGREFRGTFAEATESLLSIRIGNETRRFKAADVREVRVRKEDALANGALIGAAVGGGLTSLMFLDNECRDDPACYAAVAVYSGIGALVGLGVDALVHRSFVVYSAPSAGARLRLTPIPRVARGLKGLWLTAAF